MTDRPIPEDDRPDDEGASGPLAGDEEGSPGGAEDRSDEGPGRRAATPGAPTASAAARSTASTPGEEPAYVDDPVSKWWVGLIVAVFALIFAYALLFGGGGLLSGVFGGAAEPTTEPSPTLPASPSPAVTATSAPAPVATASPATDPEPTPLAAVTESPATPGPTGPTGPTAPPVASPAS